MGQDLDGHALPALPAGVTLPTSPRIAGRRHVAHVTPRCRPSRIGTRPTAAAARCPASPWTAPGGKRSGRAGPRRARGRRCPASSATSRRAAREPGSAACRFAPRYAIPPSASSRRAPGAIAGRPANFNFSPRADRPAKWINATPRPAAIIVARTGLAGRFPIRPARGGEMGKPNCPAGIRLLFCPMTDTMNSGIARRPNCHQWCAFPLRDRTTGHVFARWPNRVSGFFYARRG